MSNTDLYTAERFTAERADLPDRGQWVELVEGRIETRQPPDIDHGTAVLALSKAIADWMHGTGAASGFAVGSSRPVARPRPGHAVVSRSGGVREAADLPR